LADPDLINIASLIDDAKCFDLIRRHRWPRWVCCVTCASQEVIRDGCDDTQQHRQRYRCKTCGARFDALSCTALAGHHQPVRMWVLCLYFMGLNLSNRQIAQELGLNEDDVHRMVSKLREGIVDKAPDITLDGEVEIDEVYYAGQCATDNDAVNYLGFFQFAHNTTQTTQAVPRRHHGRTRRLGAEPQPWNTGRANAF
jgi:transposase-like protein